MNIILLGAPGAGKGTQGELISKKLHIPTISTGNMLREAMAKGTPLGRQVKQYMEDGSLVPDDVIMSIIAERVKESDCEAGFILDGGAPHPGPGRGHRRKGHPYRPCGVFGG